MSELLIDNKNNKYSYTNLENPDKIYLFEIKFINQKNKYIIRKIKSSKMDKLISIEDQIDYDNLNRLKITIVDINNPKKNTDIKIKINKNKNYNFINNKKIQIEISKITLNYTEINYHILF